MTDRNDMENTRLFDAGNEPSHVEDAVKEAAHATADEIAAEVSSGAGQSAPREEDSAEAGRADEPRQAAFGSAQWQAEEDRPAPAEPEKRRRSGRTLLAVVAVLLAAALCFGAGYAGVRVAGNTGNKVVLQQITSSGSGTRMPAVTEGVLTSEEVAEQVKSSVVAITTEKMTTGNYWFGSYVLSGAGSGIVISEDGYILTCAHVINGASKITVELSDGTTHEAQVVGMYVNGDVAVVKIEAEGLTPVVAADSDALRQGAVCYAVGNPEGRFSGSISDGIVSALDRTISVQVDNGTGRGGSLYDMFYGGYGASSAISLNVIQMTAAVSPGNSGGALFNDQGQLIGMVSAKSSDSDSEGLGFAIPSNTAMEIAAQLIATGTYEGGEDQQLGNVTPTDNKAVLGITVTVLDAQQAAQYNVNAGVYIRSITEESTRRAGLREGDRIISVDDVLVSQSSDVTDYLADKAPGDVVTLNVERGGRMVAVQVTLVQNPNAE